VFDHWELMRDDATEPTTRSGKIVAETRKRKGLSEDIPPLDRFLDKL